MKKMISSILVLASIFSMASCGGTASDAGSADSSSAQEISSIVASDSVLVIEGRESLPTSLPEMGGKEKEVAEKYLTKAEKTLLWYQFSEGDYEEIINQMGTFKIISEDFYMTNEDGTWDTAKTQTYYDYGDTIPVSFLDGVIQEYLPVSSEDIQKSFGENYDAAKQVYLNQMDRGGPAYTKAVATNVTEGADGILTIDYLLYTVIPSMENVEVTEYEQRSAGILKVKVKEDGFTYLSNEIGWGQKIGE